MAVKIAFVVNLDESKHPRGDRLRDRDPPHRKNETTDNLAGLKRLKCASKRPITALKFATCVTADRIIAQGEIQPVHQTGKLLIGLVCWWLSQIFGHFAPPFGIGRQSDLP
ncbi:hypothetical protein ELG93_14670 [Rhizobium ruizarguesonis]|nr:hypothetical protein ELG93_14670 [Rhizobium ruizarguesonis]